MSESLFIFRLEDEAGGSAPTPGAAARSAAGSPPPAEPRDTPGRGTTPRGQRSPDEPQRFGQAILDAIQQASRYSVLSSLTRAGADLFRPLVDLGRLFQDLRGGAPQSGPTARAGAAAAQQAFPTARPTNPTPQNVTIHQAVFNAQGARIVIMGGQILPQAPKPESPGKGRGGPPEPTPPGPPFRPGRPQLPGLPAPGGLPVPRPAGLPALRVADALPAINSARVTLLGVQTASAGLQAATAIASGNMSLLGAAAMAATGPLGALVVSAGAAALSIRLLYNRANEQAQRLAGFDATLAAAQARSRNAALQQDIRSARFMSEELSRLVEIQSRGSIAATRLLDLFEKSLLRNLLPFLDIASRAMEVLADGAETKVGQAITDAFWNALEQAALPASVKIAIDAFRFWQKQQQKDADKAALDKGGFWSLFQSFGDLAIDDPEARDLPKGTPRDPFRAPGFGPQAAP